MDFSELKGKHIVKVTGAEQGSQTIKFETADGEVYIMEHYQDCCEHVSVEDFCGLTDDLLDATVLEAFESSNDDPHASECGMWTFYNIQTSKGNVTIRWYGSSNGYYSVGVSFYKENSEGTGRWDS